MASARLNHAAASFGAQIVDREKSGFCFQPASAILLPLLV